ncbi:hypothetical protein BB561_006784 [Smittium simulii]|uniref:Major facilitator superfamily (MFS) profile domain-containing protein n=1 Tax=Smittium simulii TaxID=133385 RepID=A0A2T9Y1K0_9FUNG|nr:hypothetical protein BB561_006784 [Smittium simulii]
MSNHSDMSKDIRDYKAHKTENMVNVVQELTEEEKILTKSAIRKIDIRVLPIVMLMYIAALIDRSNIGAALANGLVKGLKLSQSEEANVTAMFYVTYILCETPSNILLKKFKPHTWFAFIGTAWSVTCILLAFCKNGTTFVIARAALGIFEAGLTPGIVSYLPYWYTRSEVAYRMTMFFSAIGIAGIIGNPIAAAFASMKLGNFMPFQLIFLFEGSVTLIICASAFFIIQDYPDQAKFFTPEEHEIVVRRLRADQGMASKAKANFKETIDVILDWRIWMYAQIYFGINNAYTVISIFAPTMIKNLDYSGTTATFMAAIPNATGFIGCVIVLSILNKVKYWKLIFIFGAITILGYAVAAYAKAKVVKLIFIAVAGFGSIPNIPVLISWMSVNQGGIYKGAIASAIVISYSSICGAISPKFFVTKYSPDFTVGNLFAIGMYVLSLVLSIFLSLYFSRINKHRDTNPVDVSHMLEEDQRKLNDRHPLFRYKL